MSDNGFQPEREAQVGIVHFVNTTNVGFTGTLKQRYTDFLVNEIAPDGTVVHLTDDRAPNQSAAAKQSKEANGRGVSKADENGPESKPEVKQHGEKAALDVATHELASDVKSAAKQEVESDIRQVAQQVAQQEENSTPIFVIAPGDEELLVKYFGENLKNDIVQLNQKILRKPGAKPAVFGALFTEPITDRPLRGRLHQDVRRIFASRLETEVVDDTGVIKITAAPPIKTHPEGRQKGQNPRLENKFEQPRGQLGWRELGGEYLHFSLYKENKDTMEVISFLARCLQTKPRDFSFAGTKDRRAATVQRVSVRRQRAQQLAKCNNQLYGARIGNFKYEKQALELGENDGNQFTITLRDCHFAGDAGLDVASRLILGREIVGKAVQHLQAHGFINYFGLQRFGTFGIGTDEIGKKILVGDFQGAVDAILSYSDESLKAALSPDPLKRSDRISRDDLDRAHAVYLFKQFKDGKAALEKMPRKFSGETAIIRYLSSKQHGSDYIGALLSINRNLKTMYVHAYQSLVWNTAASERWARHGDKVIKGDLIIIDNQAKKAAEGHEVDESGEVVVRPAVDDFAVTHDDIYQRARPLTSEEAESGKYSIYDVVLPTPGYDIEYPDNDIGDYYKEFMGSGRGGGVDPGDMRRKQKDFSLSGNYRKFIGQVRNDLSFDIRTYSEKDEQLVETDLEKLKKSKSHTNNERQDRSRGGNEHSHNRARGDGESYNRDSKRGGRQNNTFDNRRNERRVEHNMEQQATKERKSPEINLKLSAWMNLPEKLAAEDKANAEAAELAKLTSEPVNPDNIKQPMYKETYIETAVNQEGRRFVNRSTEYVGADGKAISKEEAEALTSDSAPPVDSKQDRDTEKEALNSDAPAKTIPLEDIDMGASFISDKSTDNQEGGVKLIPASQESPKKRSADKISTSTSPPLNPSASKFVAVTTKVEQPVETESVHSLSRHLNPTASEFVVPTTKLEESVAVPDVADEQAINEPDVKIAVIIKFVLGTSQYATMALRELMKLGGVKTYKPDFSSGR